MLFIVRPSSGGRISPPCRRAAPALRLPMCQLTHSLTPYSHSRRARAVTWRDGNTRKAVNRKGVILIQEEDDLIRGLLERWLSEAGYTVGLVEPKRRAKPPGDVPRLVVVNLPSPRGSQPLIDSLRQVYAAP